MNPNRVLVPLVLALAALPSLGAETVIDQLYGQRRYDLADAYWAAGQRFVDLGQADRGAEFKAKALHLFPGYVPGQAPKAQAPATPVSAPAASAPALPAAAVIREQNLQGQKIARLQFQKLLRGYLTGNAATVAAVLAPALAVNGQPVAADQPAVAQWLDQNPSEAGAPDELFNLDSLEVTDGPGTAVQIRVKPAAEAPAALANLAFWKGSQSYTFTRVGDTWKLSAVEGQ